MNVFLKASQLMLLASWIGLGLGLSGCDALVETEAPTRQGQNRSVSVKTPATEQPVAIFHAFHQRFSDVKQYVCAVGQQGYSHIQISPAQKSNPSRDWWARYQPVDYRVIEGLGSEAELKALIDQAHRCNVRVIADVVFNHMANMPEYKNLRFPTFMPQDFQPRCNTNYDDPRYRWTMHRCWLGDLPDLDLSRPNVRQVHKDHLKKLLALDIDGFRFDAAKHMPPTVLQDYINTANTRPTWNYLEVIEGGNTRLEEYSPIAAVTDFRLYNTVKNAFSYGGDLRSLRVPQALNDPRSVVFGRNYDTAPDITRSTVNPFKEQSDAHLATAYLLAREGGTPLVLSGDNLTVPFIKNGVRFRRILRDRAREGKSVKEIVLAAINSPTLLMLERGAEGFFVVNKSSQKFSTPVLDLTLTQLEGCYRELRNHFTVAIERRPDGKKYVTRWGHWNQGGMEVQARDALYFIRDPWQQCR